MLIHDSSYFYSKSKNHDVITEICSMYLNHYNFLLTLPWIEEWERDYYLDEIREYKLFDV
jgi:hypothetical protein